MFRYTVYEEHFLDNFASDRLSNFCQFTQFLVYRLPPIISEIFAV